MANSDRFWSVERIKSSNKKRRGVVNVMRSPKNSKAAEFSEAT